VTNFRIPAKQVAVSAGGTAEYERTFTDSDLSIAGLLVVAHGLGTYPSAIGVWTNSGESVWIDSISYQDANTLILGLQSFRPITGSWKLSIGV
jgi:hypothetical protein